MLGNISDFKPDLDAVPRPQMAELDRWALSRSAEIFEKISAAYESYEFHQVYHLIVGLCTVDLSSVYFDILKDRLYTAGKASRERRSSQTALWLILSAMIRAVAPILSFTAEESWAMLPRTKGDPSSVFLTDFPAGKTGLGEWRDAKLEEQYAPIWAIREHVLKALEESRQAKVIGHPREAKILLKVDSASEDALKSTGEDLSRLFFGECR